MIGGTYMLKNRCFLMISVLLLTAAVVGCSSSPSNAPADDLRTEALSAYQKILEAAPELEGEHEELADASFGYEQNLEKFGDHYDQFALSDLDQDGVPELIALTVVNFRWTPVSVYTYADGEAVLLKNPSDAQSPVTFEQNSSANGAYAIYLCGENHIHSVWQGTNPIGEAVEENYAYALEGTTLVLKDCPAGENENTVYFSDIAKANSAENRDAIMQ